MCGASSLITKIIENNDLISFQMKIILMINLTLLQVTWHSPNLGEVIHDAEETL